VRRRLDVATAWTSSVITLGGGMFVGPLGPRPEQPLELYDQEHCPWCRLVRQALTVLDLEAVIYPSPGRGTRFRPRMEELADRHKTPVLVDPNSGVVMHESVDIVDYLFEQYGAAPAPRHLRSRLAGGVLGTAASVLRGPPRFRPQATPPPDQLLELWSFDASPFCRIVREVLFELELPYLLHNVGKGSPSRPAFVARSGRMMVPYLADPNTGVEMFESADIKAYLYETYGR
jgi:glutathione S-transferase